MHRAAKTSRFLIDLSSEREYADLERAVSSSTLLQHLVASQLAGAADSHQLFSELTKRLVRLSEHAYSLRDATTLEETSQLLLSLPTAAARQAGRYYQALATRQNGRTDEALSMLETVADKAPLVYRARAIQALGAIHHRQGLPSEALRLFPDALRVTSLANRRDLLTTLLVHLEVSCIKSELGDHRQALADLENLSPLVQVVAQQNPLYFYFYQNELAVEFAELGRIAEAEAASAIALASPFARAYPEWSETREEIAAKRVSATPSVVAINRACETAPSPQAVPAPKTRVIVDFAFSWPVLQKSFLQRATKPIAVLVETFRDGATQGILDWMLNCIGARAPPARF